MSNKEIKECDERGNLLYHKDFDGIEHWSSYDKNNNEIYRKTIFDERWWEYDENNRKIHVKTSYGREEWYRSDELNDQIRITEQEYKKIRYNIKIKEYNSRTKCSRFELMEI